MRMNRTTLLVLLVAIIVTIIALVIVSNQEPADTTSTPTSEDVSGSLLGDVAADDITRLSVTNNNAELTVTITRDGDTWAFTDELADSEIDSAAVNTIVTALADLSYSDRFEAPDDIEPFGLVEPAYVMEVTVGDNEEMTFTVGGQNPAGSSYYVQSSDEGMIHLVRTGDMDDVLTLVNDTPIIQPPTPTPVPVLNLPGPVFDLISTDDLTRFEVTRGDESLVLTKDDEGNWQIEDGAETDATLDQNLVNVSLDVFSSIRAVDGLTGVDTATLGLDDPQIVIQASSADQTYRLQIGDTDASGTRYYALVNDFAEPVAVLEAQDINTLTDLIDNPPVVPPAEATAEATAEVTAEAE